MATITSGWAQHSSRVTVMEEGFLHLFRCVSAHGWSVHLTQTQHVYRWEVKSCFVCSVCLFRAWWTFFFLSFFEKVRREIMGPQNFLNFINLFCVSGGWQDVQLIQKTKNKKSGVYCVVSHSLFSYSPASRHLTIVWIQFFSISEFDIY